MNRRNFFLALLGTAAAITSVTVASPKKQRFSRKKHFIIIRNGHSIEYWVDWEQISEDESPFILTID
jgi:hypothetical protein